MKPYYEKDGITIYNADCRDVFASLSGIHLVVTSPPYNQLGSRLPDKPTGMHAKSQWISNTKKVGYWDDAAEHEYGKWIFNVMTDCRQSVNDDASLCFNHKCRWREKSLLHPIELVKSFEPWWTLRQEIIWRRAGSTTLNAKLFAPNDERIYWCVANAQKWQWNQDGASFLSVWDITQDRSQNKHPCPFPLELAKRCVIALSNENDTVLDPFMGSGTVLRAAKDLNRNAIGIDVSREYCDIAVNLLRQRVLDFAS